MSLGWANIVILTHYALSISEYKFTILMGTGMWQGISKGSPLREHYWLPWASLSYGLIFRQYMYNVAKIIINRKLKLLQCK